MSANISVLILSSLFVILLILKILQNYKQRKKYKKRSKELLTTSDVINVLFNAGLLTAGLISIFLAIGFVESFFGEGLSFTQPIINFLAGVLFIWFAIRNIFYGGKI